MKTIYTLNIGNYEPQLTELTYPLMQAYANKVGARFHEINKRKFPGWPLLYEKLQIFELAPKSDWNIYFDADSLIHPDTIDFTVHMKKDTVYDYACDMGQLRWKYDEYFLRDGRNIGIGGWIAIASDWCADLWQPLEIDCEEALRNIHPTHEERALGIEHFVDAYALSRNVAKFGLKFDTIENILIKLGMADERFFWHGYNMPVEQKRLQMISVLQSWDIK